MEHGHGAAHRFGGLPDENCDPASSAIVVLPIPFDKTSTYIRGSEQGPAALIEASRNMELYDIETESEVYRKGIYTDAAIQAATSQEMLEKAYERSKHWIHQGKFLVSLGGEHTVSYASIRAHAEAYGPLTVLQLDAHADLHPAYENNPWSHASVMARVRELAGISRVVSAGVRSLSAEEIPFVVPKNTFFAHRLDVQGRWIEQILERLTDLVYITFDLDAFDCSLMPSTGTPEPGGLDWNQATAFLSQVARHRRVVGFDVVELCPRPGFHAPDFVAAKLVYKILSYKFHPERLNK